MKHPSFLQLDRMTLGGNTDEATAHHVQECAQCLAHLDRVTADRPIPAWAKDLGNPRRRRWANVWALAGATAAAGLGLVLGLAIDTADGPGMVTAKGSPAVGIYVKRDQRVSLWDGRSAVRPGDSLRLKVVPDGFSFVTVFTRSDRKHRDHGLLELHTAPVSPEGETILPVAWRVDDRAGDEVLFVVLSREPVPELADTDQLSEWSDSQNGWWTELNLQKSTNLEE